MFSAGHDIDELPEALRDPLGWDDPLRRLVREIENFPGPVIAMVEGGTSGAIATEVVLACDLIIAAEATSFAVTPAKLGVPYNAGGMLTFLNAAAAGLAKEMIFTAQPVDAARAGEGSSG
ncbi:MAG: enoyl-CoA hydratase-related protein [Geminicoccaceae bacterium]